jgi:PST family polysaccharide transporter
VQSIVFPLSYLPAIWMAIQGYGVWSLVAQNLTYNFLWMLGSWIAVRGKLPQLWTVRWSFDVALAKRMLRFGFTVGVGMLAAMLLTSLDNFLVGTFVGLAALGFYERAYRTAQWPATLLLALLNRTAYFTYASIQSDTVRLRKASAMVLWLIAVSSLPLALVVFISAPDLLTVLYGERWLPSALFLRILVVYAVARPLWENASALLIAVNKPRLSTSLIVAQVVILAVVGLPATLLWQAVGTCLAVALAFVVGLVLAYRHVIREGMFNAVSMVSPALLIGVVVVVGYAALSTMTSINGLPIGLRLALKICYVVMAFYGLIMVVQPKATIKRLRYVWGLLRQNPQPLVHHE